MKYQAAQALVVSTLATVFSACPSSCPSAPPSKAEYIEAMDARCRTLEKKFRIEGKKAKDLFARDPVAAIPFIEKLNAELRKENDLLRAFPQPLEDDVILKEFWAELSKNEDLSEKVIPAMKNLAHSFVRAQSAKDPEKTQAQADVYAATNEIATLQSDVDAQSKVVSAAARKYGFKVCSVTLTSFSGESRPKRK